MPIGQQRRNNARGRIPTQTVPRQDMQWEVSAVSAYDVVITVPPGYTLVDTGHVLEAIIVETGEPAISTSVNGQSILIGFANVPPSTCTLRIAANDPAIRNSSGGFLQADDETLHVPLILDTYANITATGYITAAMSVHETAGNYALFIGVDIPHTDIICAAKTTIAGNIEIQDPNFNILAVITLGHLWRFQWSGSAWTATQLI